MLPFSSLILFVQIFLVDTIFCIFWARISSCHFLQKFLMFSFFCQILIIHMLSANINCSPFPSFIVNLRYNEQALTLAEQYEDFPMLIFICERNNDQEKLQHYKSMFQSQVKSNQNESAIVNFWWS